MPPRIRIRKWSAKVKTKWHPPPGLFTQRWDVIASVLRRESRDLPQAMGRLTYYINRAGRTLSPKQRRELEMAKDGLRHLFRGA
jgi:hypothetical protein